MLRILTILFLAMFVLVVGVQASCHGLAGDDDCCESACCDGAICVLCSHTIVLTGAQPFVISFGLAHPLLLDDFLQPFCPDLARLTPPPKV